MISILSETWAGEHIVPSEYALVLSHCRYGSSYMLTFCAFLLLYGRVYTFYSPKWIFMTSIGIFELGSAVSGASPTSTGFIIGRAITGLGSAGMINGAIIVMFHIIPLAKRPTWTAGFGSIMGISSVVGPLLGGAFTQKVIHYACTSAYVPEGQTDKRGRFRGAGAFTSISRSEPSLLSS